MIIEDNNFVADYQTEILIEKIPIQWIPKIELYYPDLPQFPIMYIHTYIDDKRLIACPVVVNYRINSNDCDATFIVLTNLSPTPSVQEKIKSEIENRIGISGRITKDTVIECCKGNDDYKNLLSDLWVYIEKSYGSSIPYGQLYEEIYSIPRFVAAWQPKTGRQSEMRMLYNFMSSFGETVRFPNNWSHLEYYVIPSYNDVLNADYDSFPNFKKLYSAIKKLYNLDFNKSVTINDDTFKVMSKAWEQNKDGFINNVSAKYYSQGLISYEDKIYSEKLVDAFNRHSWRAAYFISAFLTIENKDYKKWDKSFFNEFYTQGSKLKGYSEKVIACFLQQGFANEEIIPIDTWIETFYQFSLGIETREDFYDSFDKLGKLERVIWLASQSNKTNMKNFYNLLWCQRYGTIGNTELRGVNPLACSLCELKSTCVGLSKILDKKVFISNSITTDYLISNPLLGNITFVCALDHDVPKKVYTKEKGSWQLIDEFSGYSKTTTDSMNQSLVRRGTITVKEFINYKEE